MDDLMRRLTSRRSLLTGAATFTLVACTSSSETPPPQPPTNDYPGDNKVTDEYREDEIVGSVANFFGTTSQGAAEVVERVFGDLGRPNAYIAGQEAGLAVAVGLRYGEGWLYRRNAQPVRCYWTGPSVGFDIGINASKCFTLVYDLRDVRDLFQRFPGVEGTYYFIAGIGVNYLRADGITLAPMRTGVGARAGVNVGYISMTDERQWVPL